MIDLNCDLGESFGKYTIGNDEAIMDYVTSVNIACGFHAGDPEIMEMTVKKALDKGIAIGAHPGYPDLQGFGRRHLAMTPKAIKAMIIYQVGALKAFVEAYGGRLQHVKPHGALYNLAAKDYDVAMAIAEGIHMIDPQLILMGLANSEMIRAAEALNLPYAEEVFADRRYTDDLKLVPRTQERAVIEQVEESIKQCLDIVKYGRLKTINGHEKVIKGNTICIHGDNQHGLEVVKMLVEAFAKEAIEIKALRG